MLSLPAEQVFSHALWVQLLTARSTSSHQIIHPSSLDMKAGDFGQAWGGIAGIQSTLA